MWPSAGGDQPCVPNMCLLLSFIQSQLSKIKIIDDINNLRGVIIYQGSQYQ